MQDNDKKTNTILFILYSCTAKKIIPCAWHTHLLLLWLENGKKQGTKKRKQEANRPCKKSQLNQSIDSRLRANGLPGQGRLNISTHRARKELKAKRYSPNFIILPIFGPNRGSLWPIWRTRSQSKRETSLEERSGGSVFAVFLFDRFVRTCDLFFLVWWRLWRPNFFQRRLSTTIAQWAFQHGLLATRISKRRDFLTCRSSSTGPSNFLATPSLPRYANPDNNC